MKVLLDTNILLWLLFDDSQLTKKEFDIILDENNEILISSISLFEISLKYSINKLELNNILPDQLPSILKDNGYQIENIDYTLFASFYKLPINTHKDPFDRLIIWEAIQKDFYLLTRDGSFKEYMQYGLKLL